MGVMHLIKHLFLASRKKLLSTCLLFLLMTENAMSNDDSKIVTKTIYLIRHAESEENQRMQSLGTVVNALKQFTLPSSKDVSEALRLFNVASQVDTGVSQNGHQQISHMADRLAKEDFIQGKQIELVMHSPLERARQTSKGLLQCLAANELEQEVRHSAVTRVIETPLLVERTPSEWMPGSYEAFRQRIRQWEDFVIDQPEERIAVVGHSQFFKAMLNLEFKFGNCHVWEAKLSSVEVQSRSTTEEEFPTLSPRWSALKQVYDCTDLQI